MTPTMRAYLQATAKLAHARATLPEPNSDAVREAEAAQRHAREQLRPKPDYTTLPRFNLDTPLNFLDGDGNTPPGIAKTTIGQVRHRADVRLNEAGLQASDHMPVTLVLLDHEFGHRFDYRVKGELPAFTPRKTQFLSVDAFDSVRVRRQMVMFEVAFALPDGSDFEQAVLAIALMERDFEAVSRFHDQLFAEPCGGDSLQPLKTRPLADCNNSGNAWMALQETLANLAATPPEDGDPLSRAYFDWVLAEVAVTKAEKAYWSASRRQDDTAVIDAKRTRDEALAAFVAAAA